MKLIRRKTNLVVGIICALSAPLLIGLALHYGEWRFAVSGAASALLAFTNIYYSIEPKDAELRDDERDLYIARKSGSDAFKLSCWLVNAAALIFAIVYAVSREAVCLTVSLTLIAVSAALCCIYVAVSCYYYKNN